MVRTANRRRKTEMHVLQAFADISDSLREDRFIQPHFLYYIREVRVVAYSQV